MKTAISIPDTVFSRAEEFARSRNMSRSALFAAAVAEYLEQHGDETVTKKLNEVYGQENSALGPLVAEVQELSLDEEEW